MDTDLLILSGLCLLAFVGLLGCFVGIACDIVREAAGDAIARAMQPQPQPPEHRRCRWTREESLRARKEGYLP